MTPEAQTKQTDTITTSWEKILPEMLRCYLELPQERKAIEEQVAAFGKKVDEAVIVANKEKANA